MGFTFGKEDQLAFQESGTEARTAEISLYPNPVANELSVSGEDSLSPSEIRILDFSGVEVMSGKPGPNGSAILDVSNLNPGLYSIQVIAPGETKIERFIKN